MNEEIKKRIGENLIEIGKISPEQLNAGLAYQKETGLPIGKALEQLGFISEHDIIEALSRQLGVPYIGLLEEASEKLLKVLELEKILQYLLDSAKKGTFADSGTVYVISSDKKEIFSKVQSGNKTMEIRLPIGKGIAGSVAETGEVINIEDAYSDSRFHAGIDTKSGYKTNSILCTPIENHKNEIIGVFQMINKKDGKFDGQDVKFLKSLSNFSATALELAALNQEMVDKKKLETQLKIAREMQIKLFPKSVPDLGEFEIYGINASCDTVSGDYYDFFQVKDDKWIIAIGDVSGHGVPSSYIMAVLQSHLKASSKFNQNLVTLTTLLNDYIYEISAMDKYVTFFIGLLDLKNSKMEYVNAGHNPPMVVKEDSVLELKTGGPIIGMVKGIEYESSEIDFSSGDLFFSFTDGVTESFNTKDEEYGEERLIEFLKANKSNPVETIITSSLAELESFSKDVVRSDDITYLALKRT